MKRKQKRAIYQAMKSYCKNSIDEVSVVLRHCLKIEEFKYIINHDFCFPNLISWWEYRSNNILCEIN